MATEVRLIYMTAKDRAAALLLARALVEEGLLACANVIDGATSVYRWEGEAVILAKTRADRVAALAARVAALHEYDCPCVVAVPVDGGHEPFLEWVRAEVDA